jgi:transcriptional regulator with XRE-family HTH domain
MNLPAEVVAERADLSTTTVLNAESGRNPTMGTLVRILRVLGRLEALDSFLPEPMLSPMALLERGSPAPRKRAYRRPKGAGEE